MTPAGIEPATFQFVAQHLNCCATAVPLNTENSAIMAVWMKPSLIAVKYQQWNKSISGDCHVLLRYSALNEN